MRRKEDYRAAPTKKPRLSEPAPLNGWRTTVILAVVVVAVTLAVAELVSLYAAN